MQDTPRLFCAAVHEREKLRNTGATIIEAEIPGIITIEGEQYRFPVCIFSDDEVHLSQIRHECRARDHIYPFFISREGSARIGDAPRNVKKTDMPSGLQRDLLVPLFMTHLEDIASNILGGGTIVLHERIPSAFHSPLRDETGVIHLFLECVPGPQMRFTNPPTVFGFSIETTTGFHAHLLPTPERGFSLSDGTHDVVQIVGNNIYILFDPFRLYGLGKEMVMTIFRKTVALAFNGWLEKDEHKKVLVEDRPTLNEESISELSRFFVKERHKKAAELLKEQEEKVADLEARLREERRALANTTRLFKALEETGYLNESVDRLRSDFPEIINDPLVASATIVPEIGFEVHTKPVIIRHDGKNYRIGRFAIRFGLEGPPSIWVVESHHPTWEPHPHISANNGPCFGNVGEAIDDALSEFRYADALRYMLMWLESYAPDLVVWHKIEEWPLDETVDVNTLEVSQ